LGYEVFRTLKSRRKTTYTVRGLLEAALQKRGKLASADLEPRWK
jgi:hypothetical protein